MINGVFKSFRLRFIICRCVLLPLKHTSAIIGTSCQLKSLGLVAPQAQTSVYDDQATHSPPSPPQKKTSYTPYGLPHSLTKHLRASSSFYSFFLLLVHQPQLVIFSLTAPEYSNNCKNVTSLYNNIFLTILSLCLKAATACCSQTHPLR